MIDVKESFFNSLSDEQTGFFCAHEYDDNLEDLLQDHISMKQFALFAEWKKQEIERAKSKTSNALNIDSTELFSKLDIVTNLLVSLSKRIDCLESRLTTSELNNVKKISSIEENLNNRLAKLTQSIEDNFVNMETSRKITLEALALFKTEQNRVESSIVAQLEKHTAQDRLDRTEEAKLINEMAKKIEGLDELTVNLSLDSLLSFDSKEHSKRWMIELSKQLQSDDVTEERKVEIACKENAEKVLALMKKFKEDEDIENSGCETLQQLARKSHLARMTIIENGTLEYLKDLFIQYWPNRDKKETTLTQAFWVFWNISRFIAVRKHLLNELYTELFLLPFSNAEISKFNVLAAEVFENLLSIPDSEWTYKLTKDQVQTTVINNMSKWQLNMNPPISYGTLEHVLTKLGNGSKFEKLYNAWIIANLLTMKLEQYYDMVKKEGGKLKMEVVLADSSTGPELRKLIETSLDILKKQNNIFNKIKRMA